MENVVPGALQRLRAADIIRMAGLAAASLGQEYCRAGAVHSTQRQGARLSGVVEVLHSVSAVGDAADVSSAERHYPVMVEVQSASAWTSTCPCGQNTSTLCAHVAALLYQWLARPSSFLLPVTPALAEVPSAVIQSRTVEAVEQDHHAALPTKSVRVAARPLTLQRTPLPLGDLMDILIQLGLSELRSIAREYEVVTNGMNKQQLAEAIQQMLSQPEAVRRVATTLEKSQRQLLAALTLAGGSMTDDDLRGLFERFSLGQPSQLQGTLLALQSKAMLFRTSLNSSPQQRIGLGGSLLDIGWYVPVEVRAALRVMIPITTFPLAQDDTGDEASVIKPAEPYGLLADLFLVAQALDGYRLTPDDEWLEHSTQARSSDTFALVRPGNTLSADGSVAVPAPVDVPSEALLTLLQSTLARRPAFLRFAIRLLRLADILHKDDSGAAYLRVLPNAARLLLGPAHLEAIRDLFELWVTQSSYTELFDLREDGLRLRCRATSLNVPVLRPGELDTENSEARQVLVALLVQAPLNQWISFTAFARFVYRLNPAFLQRRQRLFPSPHWWLEEAEGHPLRPLQLSDWLRAEIYYLARFLYGPLHWWGVCDIVLSHDGRLLAFRLTALGGWLLNGIEPAAGSPDYRTSSHALEVINNEELLVACSPDAWPLIEMMETFMEAAGVSEGRLRYRLTPKALSEALSRGHRPNELLELLRSLAERNEANEREGAHVALLHMLAQLERWIASYGCARIYTGVALLETADAAVMRELSATTSLDEQIVRSIHPTLHILKKPGSERILDDLKRRGQSPLLHDEESYGAE